MNGKINEILDVMQLTDKDLEEAMESSQATFNIMSIALNNDPIELIKFTLYKINAESIRLTKLITLMEEKQK